MSRAGRPTHIAAAVRPTGLVTLGLAVAMGCCAVFGIALDVLDRHRSTLDAGAWRPMLLSAAITGLCGLGAVIATRTPETPRRRRHSAALAVTFIWFCSSVFGALPYILGAGISPVDAVFEATSGFTTTGATIVADIEGTLSSPLLLWRSLTQWLGGMGIVVLFVAIFPNLGVGAKDMFRNEVPGPTSEGLRPRIAETSVALWKIYAALTVALALILWLVLRMDVFDAVCHALTTLSTGGFSTHNASIGHFDAPAVEMVVAVFMLAAGVNFGLYFNALRGRPGFWRSTEFRAYVGIVATCTALLTIGLLPLHGTLLQSFRKAFFMVATTVTSTGFGTDDYMAYPPPALLLVLALMLVGGSAGSTAGGIKIARIALMLKMAWMHVRHSLRPSVVQALRMGGRPVPSSVLPGVAAFCVVYFVSLAGGALLLTYTDPVPVETALGAMLTCLSNMGPSPYYVAEDNFAGWSDAGKLITSTAMVLGRLEFFALLALLLPDLWRR